MAGRRGRGDDGCVSFWICQTCAVEHADRPDVCAICADERQWVPADGQVWTTLAEMESSGFRADLTELEPHLFAITTTTAAGIGQQSKLLRTPGGNLLWDPVGYVDYMIAAQVLELGNVRAIVASHPHMYGVQVEWSHRLGDVPVYVSEADAEWVARQDPVIKTWSGTLNLLPGVTLIQPSAFGSQAANLELVSNVDCPDITSKPTTIRTTPETTSTLCRCLRNFP